MSSSTVQSIEPAWTTRPDSSGWWNTRMAAHHLPRYLDRLAVDKRTSTCSNQRRRIFMCVWTEKLVYKAKLWAKTCLIATPSQQRLSHHSSGFCSNTIYLHVEPQTGLPDWKSEKMPNEVKKVPKKCQTHLEKRQKNAKAFLTNSVLLRIMLCLLRSIILLCA